jgi:NAD(P)H-nitrite reductase large subunit
MQAAGADARRSVESTVLVTLEVAAEAAPKVAGIRIQDPDVTEPIETVMPPDANDDSVVVCRCERVSLGQIRSAIRAGVRDMNQLKAMIGCGLGSCGGKTCAPLIRSIFRREGVPDGEVTGFTERPLVTEVPFGLFAGVDTTGKGGAG